MILVVGSTGFLGQEICRRLRGQGKEVRGLVRATSDPMFVGSLQQLGVETVQGDLKDRASLDRAVRGVDTVITTATITRSMQPGDSIEATDRDGQLSLVAAAKEAGVKQFIHVSVPVDNFPPNPLGDAKRAVQDAVKASGMTYTILQPGVFMEAWISPWLGFDYPNAKATIYGSGDASSTFIPLGDVAEYAVQSIDNPQARNATVQMGGCDRLSYNEIVRIFEEVGGKPFEVTHIPEEALRAQAAAATDSLGKAFGALTVSVATGMVADNEDALRRFPNIKPGTVREYAQRVLGVPA
jgi:uncharacterized protein YbjT (DUF2867 family)